VTHRDLLHALDAGFAGDNLATIARASLRMRVPGGCAGAVVVLSHVTEQLSDIWDGPVETAFADELRREYEPPMRRLIEALGSGDPAACRDAADELAGVFLTHRER
jgi:hypothetical protein